MRKVLKYVAYSCSILLMLCIIVGYIFLKPLDTSAYYENDYFYKTTESIAINKQFDAATTDDTLRVAWTKVSLVPPFKTPIAIDAARNGKLYESVHDSLWVRCFLFKKGNYKVAFVEMDLLVVPPMVTAILDTLLLKQGFSLQNIYLTASHTHTGIGAWHSSVVGELFAGKYDARVPHFIAQQINTAILQTDAEQAQPCKMGYAAIPTQKLVYNRLFEKTGEVDSTIRVLKIEKQNGDIASIITFSAHPTCLHENVMQLSGDWPGCMLHILDSTKHNHLGMFCAGCVGSHAPYRCKKDKWDELNYIGNKTAAYILEQYDSIPLSYTTQLKMVHQPIVMREPNYKVGLGLVLRQRWFYTFFGRENKYINMLRIGDVIFAGMPCDFSGEMSDELDAASEAQHKHLMITSFNGCFVGYVTDDRRYDLNTYETKTMNWYGPGNGSYFTELLMRMLVKI